MNININTLNLPNATITNLCVNTLSYTNTMTNLSISNISSVTSVKLTGSSLSFTGTSRLQNVTTTNLVSTAAVTTTGLAVINTYVGNGSAGTITIGDGMMSKAAGSAFLFNSGIKPNNALQDLGTSATPWGYIYGANVTSSTMNVTTLLAAPRTFVQAAASGSYYNYVATFYTLLWNTTTFQPTTTIFSASNFGATNGRISVPYNGIYCVSYSSNASGTNNYPFIMLNSQSSSDISVSTPPNATTARIIATGTYNIQNTLSWTGYLTTSDYINCATYSTTAPSVNTTRSDVVIALISRTT